MCMCVCVCVCVTATTGHRTLLIVATLPNLTVLLTHCGQLVLRKKLANLICHQMSDFKAKMHKIRFRLGLRPIDPAGKLGPTSTRRRGERRGRGRGREREREREGELKGRGQVALIYWSRAGSACELQ